MTELRLSFEYEFDIARDEMIRMVEENPGREVQVTVSYDGRRLPPRTQVEVEPRDGDGRRLYCLLAYFDHRDGSYMAEMVRAAREGWERSHPDMGPEDGAWDEFDRLWGRRKEAGL